ncbi:putative signal transduction protein with CBS domains [Methanothermus fervidus DSM 2088]|uniref:Putative signal transduction protein with CBS domains n=1 Tax=Methanothermus fervidus (strain ATCC 43054 / DSM 2088 / JCM 10308 / V24 S) TaxID=523846 RepID=E3GXL7_METFV|nr:CBS domain-containing protein [Methanothermus fervidus]pir/S41583/ yhcV homolog - Methanothermus fervidus [Methanothermus fervidus]ADP77049.1 putative signal transduction protein with CBS domains [Methanothermus fervidus DSM 2088]
MWENIKVKDVMTKNVITVDPEEDVVFAFEKLMKNKISALPVVKKGKLLGIVTATDLGHNLILDKYKLGTKVKEIMVKDVVCVSPNDTLADVVKKMYEHGDKDEIINQLVVKENDEIKGIISDGDIIRALRSTLEE